MGWRKTRFGRYPLEGLLVFILSLLFPSPGDTKLEEVHSSSLTQQCLNAGCSLCHRPPRMQSTQLRDPTTFLLFSQGLSDVIYPPRRRGFPWRGEEASMPQLRAKASRMQPGPPCPIPACALETLPRSSMVPGPMLPVQGTGELPWPPPQLPCPPQGYSSLTNPSLDADTQTQTVQCRALQQTPSLTLIL